MNKTGLERFKFSEELGCEVPEEWEVIRIKDIGEIVTGTTPSTKVEEYWGEGYPFVTPTDFSDGKYVDKTERNVTKNGVEKARIIPKDSVMVTCIASVGEVAMALTECITNQQINTIICNERANPDYIYYAMLFSKFRLKRWAGITTSPIIKKSLFSQFPLSLPPLAEQQKIAEVLSTVDGAILKVDDAIAKTERLKKGLMQRLLTRGIGHERFKESKELGCEVPEEWGIVRLGDAADDFIGGGTPSTSNPDYWNGKIAWMTSAYISGRIVTSGQRYITEKGLNESATHLIPKGNLLIATRVGIGKVAINLIDVAISQDLTGVVIKKDKVNVDFVYWFLLNNSSKLKSLAQGSTIKGVLKEDLANLKLSLPPLFEQRRIAEILSTVDEKLALERRRREKLERIKKGLMNDLLTGRKRMKVS